MPMIIKPANRQIPRGGRRGAHREQDFVAVINRSNIDVKVNDPEPPHSLIVFEAGNISKNTPLRNCIQVFSMSSALGMKAKVGDALEFLGEDDGDYLLGRARELASFAKAYEEARAGARILDLSQSPEHAKARERTIENLRRAGMQETDIPVNATLPELRKLHMDYMAGRHHPKVERIDRGQQGGPRQVRPVSLTPAALAGAALTETQALRDRVEALGGTWKPNWKAADLKAAVTRLEQKRDAEDRAAREAAATRKLEEERDGQGSQGEGGQAPDSGAAQNDGTTGG